MPEEPDRASIDPPFVGAPVPETFSGTRSDVDAYLGGDQAAFDRLWRRFEPGLEVVVRGIIRMRIDRTLRPRLDQEIGDLLQEVAKDAVVDLRRFAYRGPGSLLAWLRSIAERRVLDRVDYWRAERRDPGQERRLDAGASSGGAARSTSPPEPRDHATGPVTGAAHAENRQRVAHAIAALSPRHHDILWLKYFGGADWEEIAAAVGAPSSDAVRMEFNLKVVPAFAVALRSGER